MSTYRRAVRLVLTQMEASMLAEALGEVLAGEWDEQLDGRERAALLRADAKLDEARRQAAASRSVRSQRPIMAAPVPG